jgi:hypothetical protein
MSARIQRPERQTMERNLFALSLGLAGLFLIPALGRAAPTRCAGHDMVACQLAKEVGEETRSMGLGQDKTVMELYASAQTGTRTATLPNGVTALVASGVPFETVDPTQKAMGDPA